MTSGFKVNLYSQSWDSVVKWILLGISLVEIRLVEIIIFSKKNLRRN